MCNPYQNSIMDEQMSKTWSLRTRGNQSATRTYTVLCYNVRDFMNTKLSTQKQQKSAVTLKGIKKFILEPNLSSHGLGI